MKAALCSAFCDAIRVSEVPAGLAISTGFRRGDGDAIGFYVIGPDDNGSYRIEDDGLTLPDLEAAGADLESATRVELFRGLLNECGAFYDDQNVTLFTEPVTVDEIPAASMRFVALLLRLQDLTFLARERVASTFREDALEAIKGAVGTRALVQENAPISRDLTDPIADVVLRPTGRPPVAVFLASSEQKVYEALLLQVMTMHEHKIPCAVIALLERSNSVSQRMRQRADNRLTAVPVYSGDQDAAIKRIVREVTGEGIALH